MLVQIGIGAMTPLFAHILWEHNASDDSDPVGDDGSLYKYDAGYPGTMHGSRCEPVYDIDKKGIYGTSTVIPTSKERYERGTQPSRDEGLGKWSKRRVRTLVRPNSPCAAHNPEIAYPQNYSPMSCPENIDHGEMTAI